MTILMGIIQLENVTKRYREGDSESIALYHVSLSVEPGEFVAAIGPSGSGKSTFLSIAGVLLRASEGRVIIEGKDISNMSAKELAKVRLNQIGFILQTSNLVPYLNVLDQLLVVKKMVGTITKGDRVFAKELLANLGLGQKPDYFPEQLSGGERQRTAIARAFMNQPNIILADEPTASHDSSKGHEVVKLIAKEVKARLKQPLW